MKGTLRVVLLIISCAVLQSLAHPLSDDGLIRTKRLINGTEVTPHSWPWHVSLEGINSGIRCGGVLLTPQWVLSAAHCYSKYKKGLIAKYWRAVVGSHNLSANEPTQQVRCLDSIHVNKNFNIKYTDDDIALIKLKTPVNLSPEAQLAPLPSNKIKFNNQNCKLVAVKKEFRHKKIVSTVLEEIDVPVAEQKECRTWDPLKRISDNMICGGSMNLNVGTQTGDSGSPLVCEDNGKWVVAGLLSWGDKQNARLSIYTRVSSYMHWIDEVMKKKMHLDYLHSEESQKFGDGDPYTCE